MNLKRLRIFFGFWLICLIITLIWSQLLYSSSHYKTRLSIQYAEFYTFTSIGWLWFSPMLLMILDKIYEKRIYRVLIALTPLIITLIYYSILWKYQTPEIDFRLFAGYYYRYPYCIDIILSIFLATIIEIVLIEVKAKKTYARRMNGSAIN